VQLHVLADERGQLTRHVHHTITSCIQQMTQSDSIAGRIELWCRVLTLSRAASCGEGCEATGSNAEDMAHENTGWVHEVSPGRPHILRLPKHGRSIDVR
jgi:hypothetical protein